MNNTTANATKYFDFITTGVAYITRVKRVEPRKDQNFDPFWTVTLAFLVTVKKNVDYRYVDCTVPAKEAERLVSCVTDRANDKDHHVLAGVRVSDLQSEIFTKRDRSKACRLKGRLIKIEWLKVDGEQIYRQGSQDGQSVCPE